MGTIILWGIWGASVFCPPPHLAGPPLGLRSSEPVPCPLLLGSTVGAPLPEEGLCGEGPEVVLGVGAWGHREHLPLDPQRKRALLTPGFRLWPAHHGRVFPVV